MGTKTLVLDYDGVIVHSEPVQLVSVNEVIQSYGVGISRSQWTTLHMGHRTRTILQAVLPELDESELSRIIKEKKIAYTRLRRADPLPCRPGIVELVAEAERRQIPVAVASSSSTADIESDLVLLGLSDYVSAVIGGDAVENAKPAPDAYLRALEAVNGEPSSAVAVEDTPLGISAAKAAGLYCVAYTNDFTAHLDLSAADEIVDDLSAEVIEALL